MKITILQTSIEWGKPDINIIAVERLIDESPESDLYVLPEMWSTGFATEPKDIAEDEISSVSLAWMKNKATDRQCAICGSLAIKTSDGVYFNRHYFVDGRNEIISHYDKHHLFTYGGENRFYQSGTDHTIVQYDDFRFLLLTCYDLRFPIWSRYADRLQYDAIICVANWPESRQNAFHILTRARAIENQAYLIAVNRVGNDSFNHYLGCSCIINPIGKTIIACHPNTIESKTCELNLDSLLHKRTKFKVLEDRDVL